MKHILTILNFIFLSSATASSIHIDVGQTKTVFNNISIPKSEDDEISLPNDDVLTSYRLTGFFDLASKNQLYFLLAPLQVQYQFEANKDLTFNDTDFIAGEDTTLNYKFNSYRLGYLWTWGSESFRYWAGFVGKIRDAKTELVQDDESDSFSNVGFVPLVGLGFELFITQNIKIFSHTDALGSSQGSAYDSHIELGYHFGSLSVAAGRRILGGGADNDRVYNFAQFDTNYLRLSFNY